jgi:hypothetical protein
MPLEDIDGRVILLILFVVISAAAAQHRKPAPLTATTGPRKVQLSSEQKAAAARFEQLGQVKRRPTAQSYVRKLLSSPQSTRQAIILAEILGKPKSLRDA